MKNLSNMQGPEYWKFYLKLRWRQLTNHAPYNIDDFVFKSDEDRMRDIQEYYNPGKAHSIYELRSSEKSLITYKTAEYILFHDCCEWDAPFALQDENHDQWLEKLQKGEKISFNNAAQICQNSRLPHTLYPNLYATHPVFLETKNLTFLDALPVWEAHLQKMHQANTLSLKDRAQQIFSRILLEENGGGYDTRNYALAVFLSHHFNLVRHILDNNCCSDAPSTVLNLTSHNYGFFHANTGFENDVLNDNDKGKIVKKIQTDPLLQICKNDLKKLKLGDTIPYKDAVEIIIEMWMSLTRYDNILPVDLKANRASVEQYLREKAAHHLNDKLHSNIEVHSPAALRKI